MRKVLIVQALPLEFYPPVTNLIRHLAGTGEFEVTVLALASPRGMPPFTHEGVRIVRTPAVPSITGAAILTQVFLVLATLFIRLGFRPDAVISFEPHSSLPAILLRFWPGRRPDFVVHHHEYYAPGDLGGKGGRIPALLAKLEDRHLLPAATWISQTNAERLRRFRLDRGLPESDRLRVLPNHPPRSWSRTVNRAWRNPAPPWRLVYIGSLSLRDTYLAEVLHWVAGRPDEYSLDLYALHPPQDVIRFIEALGAPNIGFHPEGVAYDDLPKTLAEYHIGLILYKGNTLNFVYNQPNKLFEYLACGLDVWYPPVMLAIKPLQRDACRPRILSVDFAALESFSPPSAKDRGGLAEALDEYFAEDALAPLQKALDSKPATT
jgi:hypothetical protein